MNHTIGRFIAAKRREKNFTQEQLAELLGVSNKTVSKWENGKSMPDYSVIAALCQALDITVAELLDGEEKTSDKRNLSEEEAFQRLCYQTQQLEDKVRHMEHNNIHLSAGVKNGITFGSALAMIVSYMNWHSIGWAILHGLLSWGYILYYVIRY